MHAISSYRGNSPTHTHTDRADYNTLGCSFASSRCNYPVSQTRVGHFYFFYNFGKSGPIFKIFVHCQVQKGSMEEAWIKTITFPQICCHTIYSQNVNVQLNSFTFILARTISFMSGDISFTSFYLLICFFLPDTDVFVTLLRYFVCCV